MDEILRILTLKCPSCGADLEITSDMTSFACGYCGTQQMVQRRGGSVSLKLIGDAIARVQLGTDRTASELAIRRIREELTTVEAEHARLERVLADGDRITAYWTCGFIISVLTAICLLLSREWFGTFFAAGCATLAAFSIRNHVDTCTRLRTHTKGNIETRKRELKRQLQIHHEVVSS